MIEASDERVFYGQLTTRFKYGVLVCTLGFIYILILALAFKALPIMALSMWISLGIISLLLIFAILRIINVRRPMLTLSKDSLTFRSVRIPWRMISDFAPIKINRSSYVGIVLDHGAQEHVDLSLADKPLHRTGFRASMRRFGALPIPAAKGISIEELSVILERYRHQLS